MAAFCDFLAFVGIAADKFSVEEEGALYSVVVANRKNRVKAVRTFISVKDKRRLVAGRI